MVDPDTMTKTVHSYIDAFSRADVEAIVALFAADACVEDPVGSEPKVGHEAIRAFYAGSVATGAKLTLQGPIRLAQSHAAFAFEVSLHFDDRDMKIDVIDVFSFNEAGRVQAMTAYFGPTNMQST